MLIRIIAWSLEHRMIVAAATVAVAVAGFLSLGALNIDAFPDTTPVQVQVNTDVPGLVATEVERLVTFPIELVMGGLPGLGRGALDFAVRPVAGHGDVRGRQRHLPGAAADRTAADHRAPCPPGVPRPELGPVATGLGEVFHYALAPSPDKTPPVEMTQMRTHAGLGNPSRAADRSRNRRDQHLGRTEEAIPGAHRPRRRCSSTT